MIAIQRRKGWWFELTTDRGRFSLRHAPVKYAYAFEFDRGDVIVRRICFLGLSWEGAYLATDNPDRGLDGLLFRWARKAAERWGSTEREPPDDDDDGYHYA